MNAGPVAVTVDLDWACEAAIVELLEHLRGEEIPATVFVTHASPGVISRMNELEVGLHPHFGVDSSHGATMDEVVRSVIALPHNLPAFRCHRFAVSNQIRAAMVAAGMRVSSNVCTDLEVVAPFRERSGLLEIPIFLEDGGYLQRRHTLGSADGLTSLLGERGPKVILLHPMHFAINTPHFEYMADIKRSVTRPAWASMDAAVIKACRWRARGVRDFLVDLLHSAKRRGLDFTTLGAIARARGALLGEE